MDARMYFAGILEMAVIHRIGEHVRNKGAAQELAVSGADAVLREKVPERVQRDVAGRITLKRGLHERRAVAVNDYPFGAVIVKISERGATRTLAATDFFAQPALGVLRERVHVILALAESHVEHELSLGRVLEPKGREFERGKLLGVEGVGDATAVNAVPRKAIWMPGKYAIRFSRFNPVHHGIEERSPWNLGRLLLYDLGNNRQMFALGELVQLIQLRVNGKDLFVLNVGGFSGIKKIGVHAKIVTAYT